MSALGSTEAVQQGEEELGADEHHVLVEAEQNHLGDTKVAPPTGARQAERNGME